MSQYSPKGQHLLGKIIVRISDDISGLSSTMCKCFGMELHRNDVVIRCDSGSAGVILQCILCDTGVLHLKVEVMQRLDAHVGISRSTWMQTPVKELWLATRVHLPTAWLQNLDGSISVIR